MSKVKYDGWAIFDRYNQVYIHTVKPTRVKSIETFGNSQETYDETRALLKSEGYICKKILIVEADKEREE